MKCKYKRLWVDALRSNEYTQGRGVLHNTEGCFCALGVLCDVAVDGWWVLNPDHQRYTILGSASTLPLPVSKRVGLHPLAAWAISGMNDTGVSFSEIADYVESYL